MKKQRSLPRIEGDAEGLICISVLCFSGLWQHHPGILFIYKKRVVFKDSFLDITDMLSGTFSSCIYRVLCALHQTVTI